MKQRLATVLKFLAFFSVGIFIFWLVYKDQDIDRIAGVLKHGVSYGWIWLSLLIGLLSHLSRTLRWNLMIEPLGHKPRTTNTFLAVMVGYLMNLALPRMGEISRCGVLARYEKIPFTKLIGTVVVERLIDMLMLLLLLGITIVAQFGQMIRFLQNNPEINGKLHAVIYSPVLIGGILLVAILLWFSRSKIRETSIFRKLAAIIDQFSEGFRTIRTLKNKGAFVFHSVFIWLMYYVMLYVVFFAFGFTSHLGLIAGLTTFVLGSFGMVAPVQGGIGAWHFMVIEALALYGVDKSDGKVFALVAHGTTTAMLIVMGLISLLVLPFINQREDAVDV